MLRASPIVGFVHIEHRCPIGELFSRDFSAPVFLHSISRVAQTSVSDVCGLCHGIGSMVKSEASFKK